VPAFCFNVAWDKYGECVVQDEVGSKLFMVPYFGFLSSQVSTHVALLWGNLNFSFFLSSKTKTDLSAKLDENPSLSGL
jgi:hypothetical protein